MKLWGAIVAAAVGVLVFLRPKPKAEPATPAPPTPTPTNPPPPGTPLKQSEVTFAMESWAVDVLHSTTPMHGVVAKSFPEGSVLARVEWHAYQAKTGKHGTFRGVSLYWPI